MSASSTQFTFLRAIATASASCAERPGRNPYEKPKKVRLIDRVQHLDHRPLKDLVLQQRDPERPQPPVRLRYEHPASRSRSIRTPMNPGVQVPKVLFEV